MRSTFGVRRGQLSLELAKMRLFNNIVKIIEENNSAFESLIDKAFQEIFNKFSDLSENKLIEEIGKCMPNGETLLYCAAKEGRTEILKWLLRKGLNAAVKARIGTKSQNCLNVACRYGYVETVEFLINQRLFDKLDINECLLLPELDKKIVKLLKRNDGSSSCCSLF